MFSRQTLEGQRLKQHTGHTQQYRVTPMAFLSSLAFIRSVNSLVGLAAKRSASAERPVLHASPLCRKTSPLGATKWTCPEAPLAGRLRQLFHNTKLTVLQPVIAIDVDSSASMRAFAHELDSSNR